MRIKSFFFFLFLSSFLTVLCAQAQVFTVEHTFGTSDGEELSNGVIQARDGNFYGLSFPGGVELVTPEGLVSTLYAGSHATFNAHTLIQGPDGSFYGVTGAFVVSCSPDCGEVFKIAPDGTYHTLHTFTGGSDGAAPTASLILGSDGFLYGTTIAGGNSDGDGTIFRLSNDGTFTLLHTFNGSIDGSNSSASLIEASDGNFYGTTPSGGKNGVGTVFRITPVGQFTLLHAFDHTDGDGPASRLLEASPGILFGNTSRGGDLSHCKPVGCGTIFTIDFSGSLHTLYQFEPGEHGEGPNSDLFQASDGRIYGTTPAAGGDKECLPSRYPACYSSIYSISLSGGLSTSYADSEGHYNAPDSGGLVQSSDGSFWGTTFGLPPGDFSITTGTAYKFAPATSTTGPVQLAFREKIVRPNTPATLSWQVVNAASLTMKQCFAYIQNSSQGAGSWSGKQTGIGSGSNYSGTTTIIPTEDGTYTYALTCGGIESGFATLTVGTPPPITIKTTNLPAGALGKPYNVSLAATGGDGDYTWSIRSGGLPPGLALTGKGVIGGVPTSTGTFNFVAEVVDSEDTPVTASVSQSITVQAGSPALNLSLTPQAITAGQNITLGAALSGVSGAPSPEGSIQFVASGKNIGTPIALRDGGATLSGALFVSPGTYSVLARYGGDNNYESVDSSPSLLVVTAAVPGITVSVDPSFINAGDITTLTVQLTGNPLPTGTVQFISNGANVGAPLPLVSGKATLPGQVFPRPGSFAISAKYSGDDNYAQAISSTSTLIVNSLAANLVAIPPTISVAEPGTSGSTTLHFSHVNSEDVSFSCKGLPIRAACNFEQLQQSGSSGSASLQITTAASADSANLYPPELKRGMGIRYAALIPELFGLTACIGIRKRNVRTILRCLTLVAAAFCVACGVHANGTPPGSYPITVTINAGNQVATTIVTLVVKP